MTDATAIRRRPLGCLLFAAAGAILAITSALFQLYTPYGEVLCLTIAAVGFLAYYFRIPSVERSAMMTLVAILSVAVLAFVLYTHLFPMA